MLAQSQQSLAPIARIEKQKYFQPNSALSHMTAKNVGKRFILKEKIVAFSAHMGPINVHQSKNDTGSTLRAIHPFIHLNFHRLITGFLSPVQLRPSSCPRPWHLADRLELFQIHMIRPGLDPPI